MITRIFALIVLTLALAAASFAQSVVITPRKATYRRPKPIATYKKTFVVTYPRVHAATPALSRKIENAINFETTLGIKVKDEISDVQWLEEAGYQVDYNKNGILSMTLSANGIGAYPSGFQKYVVINEKTGDLVKPADAFRDLPGLAAKGKAAQQAEITAAIVQVNKDDPETENPASLFESSDFTDKNLDQFIVSDTGITFVYDYDFPHVIKALEPAGHYAFTWSQLKPYIRSDGPFGRFVR